MRMDSLTNLLGLENISSIEGELMINGNDALTSLTGLDSISAASIEDLKIWYNPSLSICEVQSICDYLVSPNGTISIYDNAIGCNSQAEVEEAWESVSVNELVQNDELNIFPNPSSTQITIELPHNPKKNTHLSIYNLNGQQLITQAITAPKTVVDVSALPSGVYFVKVVDDERVMMGKVIKQWNLAATSGKKGSTGNQPLTIKYVGGFFFYARFTPEFNEIGINFNFIELMKEYYLQFSYWTYS